jgi:hypothetical protein
LKRIPSREYRALYLPLAAANVLKGYETLALDRMAEAAEYLDIDLGMGAWALGAVDKNRTADTLGEHGFANLTGSSSRDERRQTTIRVLLCD